MSYLYATDRMEERFKLFETVALPCLKAQTDPNFQLIVVIGNEMPRPYMKRLADITAGIPQIRIEAHPPGPHRDVMKGILNRTRNSMDAGCIQFRFDDDDAISIDFVERVRKTCQQCSGLLQNNRTVAIDFSKGFVAEIGEQPLPVAEVHRPYYTAALAMYAAANCKQTIMNFAHQKIHRFMPAITIPDHPMWVRTHNSYNDSRQGRTSPLTVEPINASQMDIFKTRFALDVPLLEHTFRQKGTVL